MGNETGSGHRETAGHLVLVECHIMDILMLMDIMDIMESVRLSQRPRLKLTLPFCMEDIMDIILDMLDTMDTPILMDFMESVRLRPSLKLTQLFCMVDTMDTT